MKYFVLRIVLFSLPLIGYLAVYEIAMDSLGETVSIDEVLDEQQDNTSLFMRRFLDQEYNIYKLSALERHQPEVIIVGSSRVMQFRSNYFKESFYNGGGLLQNYKDLLSFLAEGHGERLLVIGLDQWWFKKDNSESSFSWISEPEKEVVSSGKRYAGLSSIVRITKALNEARVLKNFGGAAQVGNGGFRFDGSMKIPDGRIEKLLREKRFVDTEDPPIPERIRKGLTKRFSYSIIDTTAWREILISIKQYQAMGGEILVYLPPLSTESATLMSLENQQEYFFRFLSQTMSDDLANQKIPFIPFETPTDYGLPDTYFVDGIHPSEVFVARQVERHADKFGGMINKQKLKEMIERSFCELLFDEREMTASRNTDK
jgi:hypothetical protein